MAELAADTGRATRVLEALPVPPPWLVLLVMLLLVGSTAYAADLAVPTPVGDVTWPSAIAYGLHLLVTRGITVRIVQEAR